MPTQVLVAEDEKFVADLLENQLIKLLPDVAVTKVRTVKELSALGRDRFDVAVIDVSLADGNALAWLRLESGGPRKVIVLTSREEDFILHNLFHTPVTGIVHKTDGLDFFEMALRAVLAGGCFYSPRIQAMRSARNADAQHFSKLLSEREQAILIRVGSGFSTGEIAVDLGIKEPTVLDHRKNIMKKLDVHNQAELVAYAIKRGFTEAAAPRERDESPSKKTRA